MNKTKAIIFDCFGVLYVDPTKEYFAKFSGSLDELVQAESAYDRGFIGLQEYIETIGRLTGDPIATVRKTMLEGQTANKSLIEYIRTELKPNYKIGLLTNVGHDWLQHFFNEHELHDLFDAVVISSDEGITKPEPEIYRRAAERLGVAPDTCIMIDDREENCRGAEAAGMHSILYESYEQLSRELAARLQI